MTYHEFQTNTGQVAADGGQLLQEKWYELDSNNAFNKLSHKL